MSVQVTKDALIEASLIRFASIHPDQDKMEIVTMVVDELGVPRPTVRRVKRNLLIKLNSYVKVLT